jgi:vacuolar-type H+-ATPase subunit H
MATATKRADTATAKRLVSTARAKARKLVSDARVKARKLLAEARFKARRLLAQAKVKIKAKMATKKPAAPRKPRASRTAVQQVAPRARAGSGLPRSMQLLKAYDAVQARVGPNASVSLSALRAELPEWPRDVFNREMEQARNDRMLALLGWGGRIGKIPAPLVKGAIRERGELLVFARRA